MKKKNIKKDNLKNGIIVLDLDETLFHTDNSKIYWRPDVLKFLIFLEKYFYLIVYTAALKTYADKILNKLQLSKDFFKLKLYRTSLTSNGKDLRIVLKKLIDNNKVLNIPNKFLVKKKNNKIGLNLDNIILIDNLVENFIDSQFFNCIPIIDFYKNKDDKSLKILIKFFKYFLKEKENNNMLSLKKFLYKNLYKINSMLKIKYEKC